MRTSSSTHAYTCMDKQPSNSPNPLAEAAMARHLEAIRRVRVDHNYAYDSNALLTDKLGFMAPARWLDRIGKRFFKRPTSELQVSGYYAWARKKSSTEVKIAR